MSFFGPRIIGQAAFQRAQQKATVTKHGFGPRVTGQPAGRPLVTAEVQRLREQLAQNPALLTTLCEAELERPSGPRREVLVMFRQRAVEVGDRTLAETLDALLGTGATTPPAAATGDALPAEPAASHPETLAGGDPIERPLEKLTVTELRAGLLGLGVDPATITGTGRNGAVTKGDLIAATQAARAAQASDTRGAPASPGAV